MVNYGIVQHRPKSFSSIPIRLQSGLVQTQVAWRSGCIPIQIQLPTLTKAYLYLDDLLNIDNINFEQMVHRKYPAELQLNEANAFDTEAAFLDLNLSIHNDTVFTKNI